MKLVTCRRRPSQKVNLNLNLPTRRTRYTKKLYAQVKLEFVSKVKEI